MNQRNTWKKSFGCDEYIKKVLKENKLMQENQKLKDINKQLMKEIQWENRLNSKLSKELEGYKKKVDKVTQSIWEYHTIYGSLSTDFVIKEVEKLKEVKSK